MRDTQFFEDLGQHTPVGEAALEQIHTHKGSEIKPVGADIMGQGQADENKGPSNGVEGSGDVHVFPLLKTQYAIFRIL